MTIRVKKTGDVFKGAAWFGFNHWIRAWTPEGWLHWHASELDILSRAD